MESRTIKLDGVKGDQGSREHQAAQEAQEAQTSLIENARIPEQYSAAFESLLQGKHKQIESLEESLTELIDHQEQALNQQLMSKPGLLSLPGSKAKWQLMVDKKEDRLATLHQRLDHIKELSVATNIHGPILHELVAKKLRREEPDLVDRWEKQREEERKQAAEQRRAQKHQVSQEKGKARPSGHAISLMRSLD